MDPTRVAPLGKRRRFSNAVYLTFSNELIGMEKDTEGLVGWLVGWLVGSLPDSRKGLDPFLRSKAR